MVLEESRTATIARNKAITTVLAQDGLTIIIFDSVEGNARTVCWKKRYQPALPLGAVP
jgi:hypothetical protein